MGLLFQQLTQWSSWQEDPCWLQEIEAKSEHSSTQGEEDITALASEVGPSSEQQGQGPTSPPSSPTKATADPDDGTVGEASRCTGDQDSESSNNNSGTSLK